MIRDYLTNHSSGNNKHIYDLEQVIDFNDKELIITASIRFDIDDPQCHKYLKKMEEKQTSPIIQILSKVEKNYRHDIKYQENGIHFVYTIPEEISEKYHLYPDISIEDLLKNL